MSVSAVSLAAWLEALAGESIAQKFRLFRGICGLEASFSFRQ